MERWVLCIQMQSKHSFEDNGLSTNLFWKNLPRHLFIYFWQFLNSKNAKDGHVSLWMTSGTSKGFSTHLMHHWYHVKNTSGYFHEFSVIVFFSIGTGLRWSMMKLSENRRTQDHQRTHIEKFAIIDERQETNQK